VRYLGAGERNPEQRHGRNADLGQAHDALGTLHHRSRRLGPCGPWQELGQRGQVAGEFRIWAVVHALHQRDPVAASAARSKAVPELFRRLDAEGLWVISVVSGTGADQALAALFQGSNRPPGGQHPLDGDEALEVGEG